MSASWSRRAATILLAVLVAGCTAGGATAGPAGSDGRPPPGATTVPSTIDGTAPPSPRPTSPATPPSAEPTLEPPPPADLVAGGGRHPGEVGSYTWAGGSGSAPWLPAAALDPAQVGVATRAAIEVAVDVTVAEWIARAAAEDDPTGSSITPLGSGAGEPSFALPSGGPWVVAVQTVFAGGRGDATWYWLVTRP